MHDFYGIHELHGLTSHPAIEMHHFTYQINCTFSQ